MLQPSFHSTDILINSFIVSRWAKVLEVLVVCVATVSTGFVMIYCVNDCKPQSANDTVEFPIQVLVHYKTVISVRYSYLTFFEDVL